MCGIAGWYRRGGKAVSAASLDAQAASIFHRGPDEGGVLTDGDFGFCMRRLSILDLGGVIPDKKGRGPQAVNLQMV